MNARLWLAAGLTAALPLAPGGCAQTAPGGTRSFVVTHSGGSFLGIGVVEIDAERAKALKLPGEYGAEIKSVGEESPAAKAGLKEGDVVLQYNGQRVEGTEEFVRMVRETPPGRQVRIEVWRNGAPLTLTVTTGTRPRSSLHVEGFDVPMPPMPPMPAMPAMPPIPPMPAMPDMPHGMFSWRSSMLGIESEALTPQLASFFGVKEGVLVRSVMRGSAAEKAGIKAGDVIVKVDSTGVSSPRDITSALRDAHDKHTLPVTVFRDKKELTLTVTFEEGSGMHGVRYVISDTLGC